MTSRNYIEPNILAVAILEMCRMRKGQSFCPSDVVKWLYPQDWEFFLTDIRIEMMRLYKEGKVLVTQNGIPVNPDVTPVGPVRISSVPKTS